MQIREIAVEDDAQFHNFFVTMRDALLYQRPDAPMWSEREVRVMFRGPDPSESWAAFGLYDGERLVAVGVFVLPLLDNTDKAFVEVHVAPANRRRGPPWRSRR